MKVSSELHKFYNLNAILLYLTFNPLLQMLFLDHDIIFYLYKTLKKFPKNYVKFKYFLKYYEKWSICS